MKPFLDDTLPLYYQILNDLLSKLKSGELPPNSMLPAELDLAKDYGVSRNTIRHAISLLTNDGYLVRIPGKGTFVLDRRQDLSPIQWVVSSVDEMLQWTKQTRIDYGPAELLEKIPSIVIRDLELNTWNRVWFFRGKKYRNNRHVSNIETYLPYEIGAQINHEERGHKTMFLYIEEKLGIDITRIDQHMTIESYTRKDHEEYKEGTRHEVVIKRIFYSKHQPIELSFNYHPIDSFSLFYCISKLR